MATRGRPSFQPTATMRKKVAIAASAGMSHEQIALALGISRGTLLKYFEQELTVGAIEKRLEVVQALHAVAKRGNVAAIKALLALSPNLTGVPKPDAPQPEKAAPKPVPEAAPAPKPAPALGKKAAADADALTAAIGTDWEALLKPPGPSQLQ